MDVRNWGPERLTRGKPLAGIIAPRVELLRCRWWTTLFGGVTRYACVRGIVNSAAIGLVLNVIHFFKK